MESERIAPELRDLREAWDLLWGRNAAPDQAELPSPTPSEGPDPYGDADPEWLRLDWREHLATLEIEGTAVNYVELEPADPAPVSLVLVHGLAGCWQNWLEQLPYFGKRYRVVALDLPGFGRSPMPAWEISVPAYGDLVRDFCAALELDRVAIVGNSLGGFIAAEAVIANPGRFEKLALVSAAGISTAQLRPEPAALAGRLAIGLAPLAFSFQERALRRPKLRHSAFRPVFYKPTELRAELLYEQYVNGNGRPGFLPALTSLMGYDFIERLGAVDTPTLIVAGRNDLIVPPSDAIEYGRLLPNSETVIFDRTGHCAQLERPVRFNRLLEAFLER
jgi:pimeloyl-ACP methyl ester carboxylesterase